MATHTKSRTNFPRIAATDRLSTTRVWLRFGQSIRLEGTAYTGLYLRYDGIWPRVSLSVRPQTLPPRVPWCEVSIEADPPTYSAVRLTHCQNLPMGEIANAIARDPHATILTLLSPPRSGFSSFHAITNSKGL